jgi:hypothetical protein
VNKSPWQTSLLVLSALLLSTAAAWSQCSDPSTPSVVICTPTPGATVVYIPDVAVRFTPASGSTISKMVIYDNGRNMWQGGPRQDGGDIYDAQVYNGSHNIVVKAWDSYGNFYQAKETFYVTGLGFPFCSIPSSPGVNFCMPDPNAVLPTHTVVGAAAKGTAPIKNIRFYLDGKYDGSLSGSSGALAFTLPQQGTPYNIKAVATDSAGKTYSASMKVAAAYTYDQYSCIGNGCYPGIYAVAPLDEAYVGSTFDLDMQIRANPDPISAMRAYLDGDVIATSNGPTLQQQVTVAASGTHILTVQGWDSKGIEYRIQQNININVSVPK